MTSTNPANQSPAEANTDTVTTEPTVGSIHSGAQPDDAVKAGTKPTEAEKTTVAPPPKTKEEHKNIGNFTVGK